MARYLYGIDVSSNQPQSICKKVEYDFAIVKIGGNPHGYFWNYLNPYAKQQLKDAYAKTQCIGAYWFCYGLDDYKKEADLFVKTVRELGYLGKCVLVADFEADALLCGSAWLKKFCKRVEDKAGYAPVVYASGSVIKDKKLRDIGYPLWCANYSLGNKKVSGYNTMSMKKYIAAAKLWQFTEYGYLSGYGARLDLNRFEGTKKDWAKLAGAGRKKAAPKYTKYRVNVKTSLCFRTGAGTKYEITRGRCNGAIVNVEYIKNGWAYTEQGDWCCAKYLVKVKD